MGTVIETGQPRIPTGFRQRAPATVRAQQVLQELDARYEPAWWRVQLQRHGVIIACVAVAVIAVAGTTAALSARR
jgi:hypothetical protein